MEESFAKRIRYNSHLYRNRDRLVETEQDEEPISSGSSNGMI